MTDMTRREALTTIGSLVGGVSLLSAGLLAGCTPEPQPRDAAGRALFLSAADEALLDAVADTILPDSPSSPGAHAAGAGAAINLSLTDVHDDATRRAITAGIAAIRARCDGECGGGFVTWSQRRRERYLRTIDAEAQKAGPDHWFHRMHRLSVDAYFSSEVGMTKALRYVREPGRYNGCVPLAAGQPAWS